MEVTLHFSGEDREELRQAMSGPDLFTAALDFQEFLRQQRKYENLSEEQLFFLNIVEEQFHEMFSGLLDD